MHRESSETQATTETMAIRFQASAQGVADKSFGLNHPKNYLVYPLAVYHSEPTEQVPEERVVRATPAARQGAVFLGLVADRPDGIELSPLGQEVVRFALREYGTVDAALNGFADWKRSQQRFCDLAPRWGLLTRRVVFAYAATQLLVDAIQSLYDDGISEPTLCQLVENTYMERPSFIVELFIRGSEKIRQRVLTADGELRTSELSKGEHLLL